MATIEAIAAWLKDKDDIVLFGHVSPDGDACGSCMAMMLALRKLGKHVCVVLPGGIPAMYMRYPYASEAFADVEGLPFAPKTGFSIDVSEKKRLGVGEKLFDACEHTVMLDHHGTNTGFGEIWHVNAESAANGELVLELLNALGVEIDCDIATWLYIAIMTDCGQFGYSNVTEKTFLCAAELKKAGVDTEQLSKEIYHTRTKARTMLLATVLSGMKTAKEGRLTWACLTNRMLDDCGAVRADNEGVVNYLIEIDTAQIAVLAEEREDGTKFSLRSKGGIDVAKDIALIYGGGGHSAAAGVTIHEDMETALGMILRRAEEVLDGVKE